eukprot:s2725_g12.t1
MVQELVSFAQLLGYHEVVYRADNEPTIRQLLKLVVDTRLRMGLPTKSTTSTPYSHGNALAENCIGRVRSLTGTLMYALFDKLNVRFSTSHALWSWAMRHACWIINRFSPQRGVTPYELVNGKCYAGAICQFGEPVFGFVKGANKGDARWKRMLFLGKVETQDSFLCYDGENVVLTKSVRRISTCWKSHLAFYVAFKNASWEYKSGLGGRVVPTKANRDPIGSSFSLPQGAIEQSAFFDAEGEAVREKARELAREDAELAGMMEHDKPSATIEVPKQVSFADAVEAEVSDEETQNIFDDVPPVQVSSSGASGSAGPAILPPVFAASPDVHQPTTPRMSPSTRLHDDGPDDHENKKARVELQKKQRVERLAAEYVRQIRTVKVAEEEFFTMDEYETDLQLDDSFESPLLEEDDVTLDQIPEALWSDCSVDAVPPDPPAWVDSLADQVEVERLKRMKVLIEEELYEGDPVTAKLTTKHVHDWRLKPYGDSKRWLRRSRLVAREFAFMERRNDTFSPATSTHVMNLLPMVYLQKLAELDDDDVAKRSSGVTLGVVDVKDAFLMVDQPSPLRVQLPIGNFVVLRNLPGQRLGAKSWYWFFRSFLTKELEMQWCLEQPCLCRNSHYSLMIHVDDIMFCGCSKYWEQVFLPRLKEEFSVNASALGDVGSSISFLKRKLVRLPQGLALIPGTSVERVLEVFEQSFGKARQQTIPCDGSIQMEDLSQVLNGEEAFHYRSVVGMCLYLARDRPDLLFTVKELSQKMSQPTVVALQRLRKLMGYLKLTGDYAVVLEKPIAGHGRSKSTEECVWVLESYSDADWSSNRVHRRSTSCGIHLLNGQLVYGSSRTQRVVSLSSCESELHSLVSTLSDGLYIRRCLEFLVGVKVEHVLLTDSSSARQLVCRQGTGKIKHVAGKILWIQDYVRCGQVNLSQVSTVWNIADLGTKALSKQRVQLLLHEAGVHSENGYVLVGQEEFNQQFQKHGSSRQLSKLAKAVARVILVLGLEPTVAAGMEFSGNDLSQCNAEEVKSNVDGEHFWIYFFMLISVMVWIGFAFAAWKFWRFVKHEFLQHAW